MSYSYGTPTQIAAVSGKGPGEVYYVELSRVDLDFHAVKRAIGAIGEEVAMYGEALCPVWKEVKRLLCELRVILHFGLFSSLHAVELSYILVTFKYILNRAWAVAHRTRPGGRGRSLVMS